MERTDKILFLYTIGFPYGNSEPFIFNEIPYLSKYFHKVVIYTFGAKDREVALPPNVTVSTIEDFKVPYSSFRVFSKNSGIFISMLVQEYLSCHAKGYFFKRLKTTVSELLFGFYLAEKIVHLTKKETLPVTHYSFWMNSSALSLSILKRKRIIDNYSFRLHGFDLYKERWPHGYMPFRPHIYKYATRIYVVSQLGLKYIKDNFIHSEKAVVSYLGTSDNGINPFHVDRFTVVSCSNIIPLKRLELLASALQKLSFPITWIHFGDGTETDKAELYRIVASMASNTQVQFKGHVSPNDLFSFYNQYPISVFVNVSETEGLPVSIMEAISFGIPVLATDVGGTKEIVTEQTGWLLHKDINPSELAAKLVEFKNSLSNTLDFRKGVRKFWFDVFFAEKNYSAFCRDLLNN